MTFYDTSSLCNKKSDISKKIICYVGKVVFFKSIRWEGIPLPILNTFLTEDVII